ncbi:MAG: type III pantothenate kinase [Chthoniobacterales bacterium]|nr:type III pantothenate kinase [Chthoniobacterales bacterium]
MAKNRAYPILLVDAGNSAVKFAVKSQGNLRPRILATLPTASLTAAQVKALCKKIRPERTAAACVVPGVARILRTACPGILLIGPRTPLEFKTLVDRRTIGADRLANMAEAFRCHRRGLIVASFGTAATFDVLDQGGCHTGGAIAPGWGTLSDALESRAALLPSAQDVRPRRWTGRNTNEALRAGMAGGYAALVSRMLEKLCAENFGQRRPKIIFTGGDARIVKRLTGLSANVDTLWTLRGIAALADQMETEG